MSKLVFPHLAARLTARLSTVPTAAAGLALGLASLGWCADQLFQQQGKVQLAAALLALPLLLAVVLKFLSAPRLLQQELAHPVAGSLLPVICMATLVQSAALQQIAAAPATALWWLALIAHLSLLAGFIRHRLAHFALTDLVPAWFIPPIGFVVAVLSAPASAPLWLLLLFYGLAASVWTVWLWMTGLKTVPASRAGVFTVMLPVSAAAVGVLFMGERLTPMQLLAFGIALLGLVLATLPGRRARAG